MIITMLQISACVLVGTATLAIVIIAVKAIWELVINT